MRVCIFIEYLSFKYESMLIEKKDYGQAAVDAWYNEIKSYNFATGTSKDGGVIG